ncbi:hypothetical protein L207DRAFT_575156 [Hyaloscypha variabilis F]|uniref:CFEM domain-containing protein n=1 Tax=Hyaloscypha variabilis (strain UAMH 11265 / GT02V1 / F) TaxID=1149755 RepID=A0A2J6SCM5_HYAVF|nr:hypothetical protein L207DRAFT_575156 [Hyaloscypha variabilis F]
MQPKQGSRAPLTCPAWYFDWRMGILVSPQRDLRKTYYLCESPRFSPATAPLGRIWEWLWQQDKGHSLSQFKSLFLSESIWGRRTGTQSLYSASKLTMLSDTGRALLLFSALTIPLGHTQFISSLPQCIQDCIDQSQGDNCSVTDLACLCQASAGSFLPELITCIHSTCDLDENLLLEPLQVVCEVAGAPIPESAIQSAESEASSLDAQGTTTVTAGGASATGDTEVTTTVSMTVLTSSVSTKTVTKTKDGSTIYVVYPLTVGSTTTVSGKPSTLTTISTHTTKSSSSEAAASGSISSTTTFTTSVEAAETSSSGSPSKTSPKNPAMTNSSPFTTTNGNGASKEEFGSLLGFSIFLMACCFWY